MKLIKQKISGLLLIKPILFRDNRGYFRRHFCKYEMKRAKVKFDVKQGNFSENLKKGTLRGFHYQKSSKNDSKILSCVSGSLINVTVDLRRRSETFLKSCILKISSKS